MRRVLIGALEFISIVQCSHLRMATASGGQVQPTGKSNLTAGELQIGAISILIVCSSREFLILFACLAFQDNELV